MLKSIKRKYKTNSFFKPQKKAKKLPPSQNSVKQHVETIVGKFQGQPDPKDYFQKEKSILNILDNCIDKMDLRIKEASAMDDYVNTNLMGWSATSGVNKLNEIKIPKLRDDKLNLYVHKDFLSEEGNPIKLFKYGYGKYEKIYENKSGKKIDEKELALVDFKKVPYKIKFNNNFIHDIEMNNNKSHWYEDTSKPSHIAISVLSHSGIKSDCCYCGTECRHPLGRFKFSAEQLFENKWIDMINSGEAKDMNDAMEKYPLLPISLLAYYKNILYVCKNCDSVKSKCFRIIHKKTKNKYTKKEENLNFPAEVQDFENVKIPRAQAFNISKEKAVEIMGHRWKWNPLKPGLSERVGILKNNINKFTED